MKKLFPFAILIIVIAACSQNKQEQTDSELNESTETLTEVTQSNSAQEWDEIEAIFENFKTENNEVSCRAIYEDGVCEIEDAFSNYQTTTINKNQLLLLVEKYVFISMTAEGNDKVYLNLQMETEEFFEEGQYNIDLYYGGDTEESTYIKCVIYNEEKYILMET